MDLTGGSLTFELRVQDQFADKVSKFPLNILDIHADAREVNVAKENLRTLQRIGRDYRMVDKI